MNVKNLLLFFSFLLFQATCTDYAHIPHQDEATTIVWRLTYGDADDDPPDVSWVTQEDLNCGADSTGRFHAFYRDDIYGVSKGSTCVGGVTWESWRIFCQVALPDGETFSTTAFSHELYHAYLRRRDGDGNSSHSDPGFGITFGHPYGLVDLANDNLKKEGL